MRATGHVGGYVALFYLFARMFIELVLTGCAFIGLVSAVANSDGLPPTLRMALGAGSIALLMWLIPEDYSNLLERRKGKREE